MNDSKRAELSNRELERYSRHILLNRLDYKGQQKISRSHVLIVGAGGLGCAAALYLAASGVGQMSIVDFDCIELSNLQRQIAHQEKSIGMNKAVSLQRSCQEINADIAVNAIDKKLSTAELLVEVTYADVVLDCSDNSETRQQVNRVCLQARTPLVSGAAIRFEGQLSVFDFRDTLSPCYACLYTKSQEPEESLSCSQAGIFSPVVGVVGAAQAIETLKLLANIGGRLTSTLGLYDALQGRWRYMDYPKQPNCSVCDMNASDIRVKG